MNRIYLLEVDHSFQSYKEDTFRKYIKEVVKEKNVDLIAEEYSTDVCKMYHPDEDSQLRQIANTLKIKHLYCDPTKDERRILGIKSETEVRNRLGLDFKARVVGTEEHNRVEQEMEKQWIIREKEWLHRLISTNASRIVFVLGNVHKTRFSKLLSDSKFSCEILENEDFKNDISPK